MSSAATRVRLEDAERVAAQLVGVLGLGCERIEVAGSIRRRRDDVGDIELVAVPRVHQERLVDGFFDARDVTVDELQVVLDTLLMDGTLTSHPDDPKRGPRYSKWIHVGSGLQVDLFSARRDTFGLILAIRTGPAPFSQTLVSEARRRGHHVAGGELHVGGHACPMPFRGCELVPTPEEGDLFRTLGLFMPIPEQRA